MNHTFVTDGSSLTIQVENTGIYALVVYEKEMPPINGTQFFLSVKGNMTMQVRGSIEIYYKDKSGAGIVFPDYTNTTVILNPSKYVWMYSELDKDKVLDKIRLVVESDAGSEVGTYFFQIDVVSVVG